MCALCGVLGVEHHWSAAPTGPAAQAASADPAQRRADRRHRIAAVNAVLAPARLKVAEWRGTAYLLRSATGRTHVVDSLADLWPAAQAMAGRSLDPLDPALLDVLEGAR
ncbi:MAG: hypothetical protein RIB84_09175 [Sneathiellaceae bacterium]